MCSFGRFDQRAGRLIAICGLVVGGNGRCDLVRSRGINEQTAASAETAAGETRSVHFRDLLRGIDNRIEFRTGSLEPVTAGLVGIEHQRTKRFHIALFEKRGTRENALVLPDRMDCALGLRLVKTFAVENPLCRSDISQMKLDSMSS